MIYPTICVSFPRSGFHALQSVLTEYFGAIPPYGEVHDLNLDEPLPPEGTQLLLQMRNPFNAIQSWTDLDARFGPPDRNSTRELWATDFSMKASIWEKWCAKWMLPEIPGRLVVFYERLLDNPYGVCESVIQFLTHEQADGEKLRAALKAAPIASRKNRISNWLNVA